MGKGRAGGFSGTRGANPPQSVRDTVDLKAVRAKALYDADKGMTKRKSHESTDVKKLYDEWYGGYPQGLGKGNAHHDLHTSYVKREQFHYDK